MSSHKLPVWRRQAGRLQRIVGLSPGQLWPGQIFTGSVAAEQAVTSCNLRTLLEKGTMHQWVRVTLRKSCAGHRHTAPLEAIPLPARHPRPILAAPSPQRAPHLPPAPHPHRLLQGDNPTHLPLTAGPVRSLCWRPGPAVLCVCVYFTIPRGFLPLKMIVAGLPGVLCNCMAAFHRQQEPCVAFCLNHGIMSVECMYEACDGRL